MPTEREALEAVSPPLADAVFNPAPAVQDVALAVANARTQSTELSEDDFIDQYKPLDAPSGSMLWERDEVLPLIDAGTVTDNNVWTVVDTDEGDAAIAGWHVVNVFAYMVTEVPWVTGDEGMAFDPTGEEWCD